MLTSIEQFDLIDIHCGKIIGVEDFPKAKKPAFKLMIDFGATLGIKRSSAQITDLYTKEELMHKVIFAVTNFPPRQVADFISEVLVLGVNTPEGVVLLGADKELPLGLKVS